MLKASFSFLSFETNPPFLPGTSLPFGGLKTTWWFGNWATEGSEEIFTPSVEFPIRASHGPRASVEHASGHTLPVWDLQVPLRAGCLECQTFSHRAMIINGSLTSGPASQNSILRTIYLSKYSDSLLSLRHVVSLSCSHRLGSSGWHSITEEPVQGLRGHLGSWFHFPDSEENSRLRYQSGGNQGWFLLLPSYLSLLYSESIVQVLFVDLEGRLF